ncbi:hypothetical protein CN454_29300 [Bacillus cereus]|uniref:protein NO VEIN domain-containing protein n=1 Tax=Bacillus cereus TaxID=1396 RepID=UPI000BFA31B3|nr:DUF3883 domain-containing protein [Bacillus cereus]MDR4440010.1 DUF3883 domain-containing protein [Bacillus cereus]PEX05728.1 hypothetical protein CN454_29300 [Bacillus cereus]
MLETKSKLELTEPATRGRKPTKSSEKGKRNIEFEKKTRINKKIGYAREPMVLKYERDFLKLNGRSDLADCVEHVSKTKGDRLGYDIVSSDYLTGNEKHIEVKKTTGDKDTPFLFN